MLEKEGVFGGCLKMIYLNIGFILLFGIATGHE